MNDSAMSSNLVIVIFLGEVVVKDRCKRSFPRWTYTVEIVVMHSLLMLLGKLFGLSTVLRMFSGSHFAKLDDLHHLSAITNSWDLSFNAKAANILNDSAFFHFELPVENILNATLKDALRLLSPRLTLVVAHLTWQPPSYYSWRNQI
ncbi:hypothetical protein Nepgr_005623 [Nepenthes gracilis]|uniref:Uncharacterized protein n=1 Tax=Nepenthes gracilis TaxID=150966 RepID=A0AAD3S3J4_NEPGR|nr:hypothetical protein Nepgr_005623 [Nepenthes gracilis]